MAKKFHDYIHGRQASNRCALSKRRNNHLAGVIGEYGALSSQNDSLLECFSHNLDYLNDDVMNQALVSERFIDSVAAQTEGQSYR